MSADGHATLGAFLTGFEAQQLACAFAAGETTSQATKEIHPTRRAEIKQLLADANLGHQQQDLSVAVLQAIAGAKSQHKTITPVWTMPGNETTTGHLTNQIQHLINNARISVVCSSFNFSPQSHMWTTLHEATMRPQVHVTVYVDAQAGSPDKVAARLPLAHIYRTLTAPGMQHPLVNHAKFIIIRLLS